MKKFIMFLGIFFSGLFANSNFLNENYYWEYTFIPLDSILWGEEYYFPVNLQPGQTMVKTYADFSNRQSIILEIDLLIDSTMAIDTQWLSRLISAHPSLRGITIGAGTRCNWNPETMKKCKERINLN